MKTIGSVKEDLSVEKRVSITPEIVKKFTDLGFSVNLEKKYAEHLGINDEEYKEKGANINFSKEEVFGPVVALYPFKKLSDAIQRANDVDLGLQAGVFTSNLNTAHRIADALQCGGVIINDSSDYRVDAMPFGGMRGSGLGREGVVHAIHEMTELKTYCFNL